MNAPYRDGNGWRWQRIAETVVTALSVAAVTTLAAWLFGLWEGGVNQDIKLDQIVREQRYLVEKQDELVEAQNEHSQEVKTLNATVHDLEMSVSNSKVLYGPALQRLDNLERAFYQHNHLQEDR